MPTETRFTRATDRKVLNSRLFAPGEPVVVAVSGGQDSTALLLILDRLSDRLALRLTIAHFDHQLRSRREAKADLAFVEALARGAGLPLEQGSAAVRDIAKAKRLSIEDAARRERYAFLGRVAGDRNGAVAVGHTRDDRAETILLHLLRGAGVDGLVAMPEVSSWPFGEGPRILRPLLALSREETLRYCRESGIEPRSDPTNDLPVATRNRVRAELVPLLRTFNPRVDEALVRLSEALAADAAALDSLAQDKYSKVATRRGAAIRMDREALKGLPAALAIRLVRRAAGELGGEVPSAQQVDAVLAALARPPAQTSLPGKVMASASARWLELVRQD